MHFLPGLPANCLVKCVAEVPSVVDKLFIEAITIFCLRCYLKCYRFLLLGRLRILPSLDLGFHEGIFIYDRSVVALQGAAQST